MLATRSRWLALAVLILASCSPQAAATGRPESNPTSTATPSPTIVATPTLAALISRPQLTTRPDGQIAVTGILTNRSDGSVEDLRLNVRALAADGSPIGAGTVKPLLPWLPAGGESPYQLTFTSDQPAAQAEAALASYQPSNREPALVQVEIDSVRTTVDGGSRVLGWLQPPRTSGAALDGLVIASFDGGALHAISGQPAVLHGLPAHTAVPFEAVFAESVEPLGLTPYLAAQAAEEAPDGPLKVDLEPGLQLDSQGNPFITGVVRNGGDAAIQPDIVLAISQGGRLLRVLPVEPGLPVGPGESRPFGLRQLALPPSFDPATIQLQAYVGWTSYEPPLATQLSATITSFEPIGGSLFLRGQVENATGASVRWPTLLAAVRSTDGQLWSAASLRVADQLAEGAMAPFVIDLPLPPDADPRTAEFDIRALAIQPESTP